MIKALKFWDRFMYAGLLLLVIFVPYSSAMIQAGLAIMMTGWIIKRSLAWKANPHQGFLNSYKLPVTGVQWPLVLIGLLIIATLPWSHVPALTFKKFFSRFLQQIILMYLAMEVLTTPKRLYGMMSVFLWTMAVVAADTFIQYFRGCSFIFSSSMLLGQRVNGPMRHSNDLGTLLVMSLPVILSLIITRKYWVPLVFNRKLIPWMAAACVVLFLLLSIALGLTFSRGAWLAFAVTFTGWSIYLKKYRLTALIIVVLLLFFWFFGVRCIMLRTDISPAFKNSAHAISFKKGERVLLNPSSRYIYWDTAKNIIQRYPVFGCGFNTYIQTLQQLKIPQQEYPHNSVLHIASEMGIVGLAGYLWFWGALFFGEAGKLRTILEHGNRDLYILGSGVYFSLLAWLIHSLIDTAWESLQLSILWWLLVGVLLSLAPISKKSV